MHIITNTRTKGLAPFGPRRLQQSIPFDKNPVIFKDVDKASILGTTIFYSTSMKTQLDREESWKTQKTPIKADKVTLFPPGCSL